MADGLGAHVVVIDDTIRPLPTRTIKGHYRKTFEGEVWVDSRVVTNWGAAARLPPRDRWRILVKERKATRAIFYLLPPRHLQIRSETHLVNAVRDLFPTTIRLHDGKPVWSDNGKTIWMISANDMVMLAMLERV